MQFEACPKACNPLLPVNVFDGRPCSWRLVISHNILAGMNGWVKFSAHGSCPFELVKVRRQLEYQIARDRLERAERLRFLSMGRKFDPAIHASKNIIFAL
jgi:hypothetical protein